MWAFLFVLIAGASIAAPLALRGHGVPPLLDASTQGFKQRVEVGRRVVRR